MRVLMLSWEYPPNQVGGLGRHVQDLARALVAAGEEIHVVTWGQGDLPADAEDEGVQVHRAWPFSLTAPDFLTWVLQVNMAITERAVALVNGRGGFDVLHAHDWLVAFAGRILKHAYQVPLVATIHATEAGRNHGLHNDLQRYISSTEWWLTYEAWRVIVCSQHMRGEVQGLFQLPPDKLVVIPNGVDAGRFRRAEPEPGLKDRFAQPWEQIVLYVGRLVREKGVHVLLDAAPAVLAACPQAKFVIAGSGPMEGQLKHQAASLGLQSKVHFTGFVSDDLLARLYRLAAVAVFPSLYEPFGIVALEAMAAGTPVLVSATGGFAEVVTHGVNGLQAYPGDASSLAANLIRLLQDGGLAAALREEARRQVDSIYDWGQIARQTAQVYRQVRRDYRQSPWYNAGRPFWRVRSYVTSARRKEGPETRVACAAAGAGHDLLERRMTALDHRGRRNSL